MQDIILIVFSNSSYAGQFAASKLQRRHVVKLLNCRYVQSTAFARNNICVRLGRIVAVKIRRARIAPVAPFSVIPYPLSIIQPRDLMTNTRIIIQGITTRGRAFRPSDWAERLCGIMSTFAGDQQMRYSPYVRPMLLDGVRCVVVELALADMEPRAYRFLLDFARDNELTVIDPNAPLEGNVCPIPNRAMAKLAEQK